MSTEERNSGSGRFWLVIVILLVVFGALFALGLLPRLKKDHARDEESTARNDAKPVVTVQAAKASPNTTSVTLPADLRSNHETFLFARVNGFVQKWNGDIGQHVRSGQVMATITTPEIDQQIAQAQANLELARTSFGRLQSVTLPGAISKQELDAGRAQYAAQQAAVRQLQAQRSFRQVIAPFNGTVTQRNVDVGTLVTGGNATGTQLFKVEQTDTLRAFVDVPQNFVPSIRRGLKAQVLVPEFPTKPFQGIVARDAEALDPQTRTLRTEVRLPNRGNQLRPGTYGQVRFDLPQTSPTVLISANALIPSGTEQKVVIVHEGKVHFQPIVVGRDFGANLEVTQGLQGGEMLVINPGENLTEGLAVDTKKLEAPKKPAGPAPAAPRPNDPDAPRVSSPLGK
jgi:membrane fusion protein (multidrug efflux system)